MRLERKEPVEALVPQRRMVLGTSPSPSASSDFRPSPVATSQWVVKSSSIRTANPESVHICSPSLFRFDTPIQPAGGSRRQLLLEVVQALGGI
jgi:hypothetical protein